MWTRYNEPVDFSDKDLWDSIVVCMDDDKRETVHFELAPCSEKEFLESYIELEPEFERLLAEEFSIERR